MADVLTINWGPRQLFGLFLHCEWLAWTNCVRNEPRDATQPCWLVIMPPTWDDISLLLRRHQQTIAQGDVLHLFTHICIFLAEFMLQSFWQRPRFFVFPSKTKSESDEVTGSRALIWGCPAHLVPAAVGWAWHEPGQPQPGSEHPPALCGMRAICSACRQLQPRAGACTCKCRSTARQHRPGTCSRGHGCTSGTFPIQFSLGWKGTIWILRSQAMFFKVRSYSFTHHQSSVFWHSSAGKNKIIFFQNNY